MRALRTIALCASAAVALSGCEGENLFANADPVLANEPLVFEAVVFEFENEFGETRDLVAEGARFRLALDEEAGEFDSRFEFRDIVFGVSGTFAIEPGEIIFSDDPFENDDRVLQRSFDFIRADDRILLEDPETVFDVDNDGTEEVASLQIRLEPPS